MVSSASAAVAGTSANGCAEESTRPAYRLLRGSNASSQVNQVPAPAR
ncbi:hypothetical protein OG320_00940 [Microbispora sp. NBC_01189]|nr:hypothetical protein OG320_00940 [Microbispora sp. NBC_01189]